MGRKNKMKGAQNNGGAQTLTLPDGSKIPIALPPGMTKQQMAQAVAFMKANPAFAKQMAANSQKLDPRQMQEMLKMQQMYQSKVMQEKMALLKDDPELAPMWEDIKQNGQAAMKKYWDDPEWISKVSEKMGRLRVKPRGEVKTLHDAAKAGDVAKAEALLAGEGSGAEGGEEGERAEPADVNAPDSRGIVPLGVAVGFNQLEMVAFLLKHGADVGHQDARGNTPLHYAAGYGRLDILQALLAAGADKEVRNSDGQSALDVAELNREAGTIRVLKGEPAAEPEPKAVYL